MVLLAFSLQTQVEKYGAYVGIASFFGLAVLSLLYFAQAREVRRLRDWAGRSPERAQELEQRVVSQAEAVRRVPQPVAARPAAAPVAPVAVASNGAHKLKPEQVAALAFARAAGVAEPPHPPKPVPVPVPQPVAVGAAEATVAEPATVPPPPAPDPGAAETPVPPVPATGNGHGTGEVPAPATPAGRRPPAAPLRATPPPARRPAPAPARRAPSGPPPRRETSMRSIVLLSLLGVIVLAGVVFAATKVLGGGGSPAAKRANSNPIVAPGATATPKSGSKKPKPAASPARATVPVLVLNGTPQLGLAADMRDRLINAGYDSNRVGADNDPQSKSRPASVVLYTSGASAQAHDVARVLAIHDIKPIDAAAQAIPAAAQKSVVVEVGMDKSGN
jgi:hypothetical protein